MGGEFFFWVSFLYGPGCPLFTPCIHGSTWINMDPIFCVYKNYSVLSIKKKKKFVTNMWKICSTSAMIYFILVWFGLSSYLECVRP